MGNPIVGCIKFKAMLPQSSKCNNLMVKKLNISIQLRNPHKKKIMEFTSMDPPLEPLRRLKIHQ